MIGEDGRFQGSVAAEPLGVLILKRRTSGSREESVKEVVMESLPKHIRG